MPDPQFKGRILVDSMKLTRDRLGEQFLTTLIAKLDEPLRKIVEDGITQSEWYPIDLLTQYLEINVKVMGLTDAVFRKFSEEATFNQLTGTYRALAQVTPEEGLRRFIATNQTYFRDLPARLVSVGPKSGVIRYEGLEPRHRLLEPLIAGYARQAMLMRGGKRPQATFTVPIGDPRGYAELRITWE